MKNWKKQTGVWIDTSKAVIVTLFDGRENMTEIQSGIENKVYHDDEGYKGTFSGKQHGSSETKFDERKKNQFDHFLKDVLSQVKESDELYIFGPSEARTKLEQKIHDDKAMSLVKLRSVQAATSYMTPNQIMANVKDFYKN